MKKRLLVIVGISLLIGSLLRQSHVHAQDQSNVVAVAPIFIPPPPVTIVTNSVDSTNSVIQSQFPTPFTLGLLAQWSFDEGQGTNVADSSGHGQDGTLVGAPLPVWSAGVVSNALLFDGAQNYVTVPDQTDLTPKDALTLVAWVKASPTATGVVIDKWGSGSSGSYGLSLTNGSPGLELSLDGVYRPLFAPTAITDTNWHYVAGSYDGTQMVVYVDGAASISAAATGKIDVVEGPLRIGEFAGAVDEARIYGRALSSNEVAGLFDESAAVESGQGATAGNSSQNNNGGATGSGTATLAQGFGDASPTSPFGQTTWYVDALNGNNNNDGLANAPGGGHGPKQSIQAVLSTAKNQDIVVVAGGTYSNTTFDSQAEGITFQATGAVIFR